MSLLIRQSRLNNSQGGEISYQNLPLYDDSLVIDLSPEESFFSTEIYKAFYIQNTGPEEITDMSLVAIGGIGSDEATEDKLDSYFIEEASARKVDMIDNSPSGAIIMSDYPQYDSSQLTFYDWLYDRYKRNLPPYHPHWQELEEIDADYPDKDKLPQRQEFENLKQWFKRNIINPAPTRKSMFNQLDTGVYVPSERILNRIDESTELLNFSRRSRDFPYLDALDQENPRAPGNYWGFYLKISVDFIPDWEIGLDFTSLVLSWTSTVNGISTERQKIIKITVNGNMGDIVSYNNLTMENLYNNYPPFFKYYEDK